MFYDFLFWLNGSATRYWTSGGMFLAVFLFSVFFSGTRAAAAVERKPAWFVSLVKGLRSPWVFGALLVLTVTAFRWPGACFCYQVNVDESQMGAQAMKYLLDIVPWRSVDGTTSGPLNSWILMVPAFFGFEIGYVSGRIMGLLCVLGMLLFSYGTLRRCLPEFHARLGAACLMFFFAFATEWNFIHYSSEHVPFLLMAGGIYFGTIAFVGKKMLPLPLTVSAILFGALPWAKFQAGPVGFFGVLALMAAVRLKCPGGRLPWRLWAWCAVGGLSVAALIMAMVIAGGAFEDFVISYLGLVKHHENFIMPLDEILQFLNHGPEFVIFFIGAGSFGIVAVLYLARENPREVFSPRRPLFWFLGYLLACVFIVFKAGKSYPHYALFLVHPMAMAVAVLLGEAEDRWSRELAKTAGAWRRQAPVWLFIILTLIPQGLQKLKDAPNYKFVEILKRCRDNRVVNPVVDAMLQHVHRGDRLVVWGWNPAFYLESGLIQGTRDAIAQMAMFDYLPHQEYYRRRFLNDMMESRPHFFIDADTPYYPPYERLPEHGHEKFPALADYVRSHYSLRYSAATPDHPEKVRVYLRNDLMDSGQAPPAATGE